MKQKWWIDLQEKGKKAENWDYVFKRIVYILCFVWLCYVDHIIGSAIGYVQFGTKHYAGVAIAIIILTTYKPKDFLKLPYFVWLAVFFIGKHFVMKWAPGNNWNPPEVNSYLWNVGIYGVIIIRMLYGFLVEKKRPSMNWPLFSLWLIMMIGMVIVRPDVRWTGLFLVFFGLFYLTDFNKKDLNNLFIGMIEGILIGFVLIQGYALLHRPYDEIRYEGLYSNPNINALFYVFSYGALLCKWYFMKLKKRPIWMRIGLVVLAGIMIGLTFLTMCRTALLTMVVLTMFFLLFQMLSVRRWYRKILACLIDSAALLLAMVLCFIPTYNMVRYIPAYADDPIYYEADKQDVEAGKKIEKGDPINSEKYHDFETVVSATFSRVLWFQDTKLEDILDERLIDWMVGLTMKTEAAEEDYSWVVLDEVYVEPGTDALHPIMSNQDAADYPERVRMNIYKYYLDHLKPFGQRDGVENVWITEYYYAPHAHNILLQMAGDFGWVLGVLFAGIALLMANVMLLGLEEKKNGTKYYQLYVMGSSLIILFVFGMLEISWVYGQLPLAMFYFVQYFLYHKMGDNRMSLLKIEKDEAEVNKKPNVAK